MKRIAKFHKVSKERFTADWIDTFAQSQEEAEKVYEAIRLPKRAPAGSARQESGWKCSRNGC